MPRLSQKDIIKAYLRDKRYIDPHGGWVHTWELVKVDTPRGYLKIGADRRAREMASDATDVFDPYYRTLEREGEGKYERYRYRFTEVEREEIKARMMPKREEQRAQIRLFTTT